MRVLHQATGRVRFAVGHEGRLPTLEDKLERLREEAESRRTIYRSHPCHACEIALVKAELLLEEFEAQHPGILS